MKKLLCAVSAAIIVIFSLMLCGCYRDIYTVAFTQLNYNNNKQWNKAQGLAADNEYFYFAGHHDKTGENADIHVIDKNTLKEVRVLSKAGAMHSAGVEYYPLHDTLLTSSGGEGRAPFLYEINKRDGTLLNSWDFAELGEKGGANVAVVQDNIIVLFTSSENGAKIAFTRITLLEKGGYTADETYYYNESDLGVPQGFAYYNGNLYYLADAGITVNNNPHYLYRLDAQTYELKGKVGIKISAETQGIHIEDGILYFATAKERLYKSELTVNEFDFK